MKLAVVVGTVRENRLTGRLAKWIVATAEQRPEVEVDLIDLRDFPMPFFSEPMSPRYNPHREIDPTAQKWLAQLQAADAYVFVTPEYNHSIPGVLKNALDYVTWEMVHKPATVASHGTVGGARAAMMLKEILSESRAAVVPLQLAIPALADKIDGQGVLSEEQQALQYGPQASLNAMLDDLLWYGGAMAAARAKS